MQINPMKEAIRQAELGIARGHGGPFGAVVVKDGKIIARGHNRVLADVDSTAHGEIVAIRKAEKALKSFDLSGCELYTTGEPCPMCLAACLWANVDRVYFGCSLSDNSEIGFRDSLFASLTESGKRGPKGYLVQQDREACRNLFDRYAKMEKEMY